MIQIILHFKKKTKLLDLPIRFQFVPKKPSMKLQSRQLFHRQYRGGKKMRRMDKEQAVIEQLTLTDFKMWDSTTLNTFNNYSKIMINIIKIANKTKQ